MLFHCDIRFEFLLIFGVQIHLLRGVAVQLLTISDLAETLL